MSDSGQFMDANLASRLRAELTIGFRIAHRARLTHFLAAIALAIVVACVLASQFSGRQPATVALDVGISVLRLCLPILSALLLQELFFREFDRRFHVLSLTYPRSRFTFLVGRSITVLGFSLVALILLAATLWLSVTMIGRSYVQALPPNLGTPFVVTMAFITLDLAVTVGIGTLISISASSSSFVLVGTLGFVVCARSFSPIIDLLSRDNTLVAHSDAYQSSLGYLGYILPDLARLDVRLISLYDKMDFLPANWPLMTLSTAGYAFALFSISAWIFNRRSFS